MCMIAYRPAGRGNIPNSVVDTAIMRHSDGFGIAYRVKGALVTQHYGPTERKHFRKALRRIDRSGSEYVAHFRFATHGPHDAAHAHPYEYTDPDLGRVLVFHNGVIDIATKPSESDTEVFVRDVLAKLGGRWWANPVMKYLVNAAVDWSKLVIMTKDETVNLHESRGDWDGGLWYSSNHKPAYTSTPGSWGRWDNDTQSWTNRKDTTTHLLPATTSTPALSPSAQRSAAALGLLDPADPSLRDIDAEFSFKHAGHYLTALKSISLLNDGDYEDSVICDTCRTIGTIYVIDGAYYVDMAHNYEGGDDEDDERGGMLSPVTLSAVASLA